MLSINVLHNIAYENSPTAQDIACKATLSTNDYLTSGLLITAIISLIVLIAYTYYTWEMSKIMRDTYLLERRPYLCFNNLEIKKIQSPLSNKINIQIGLMLNNIGRVPLTYRVNRIVVTVNGQGVPNPTFVNLGGTIFPSASTIFRYPIIPNCSQIKQLDKGTVEFDISYYCGNLRERYRLYREIEYFDIASDRFETVYRDEFSN